ncbi:MAG: flagellar biosynthetic protein FliR, partial [Planctomycetes bacterium]|nr:flagellar biosynthetic protein FliR [Planctomycetota bacterium]
MNLVDITLNEFLILVLVLLRMSGVVVFAPFFGGENLPQRARIGLVVFLSIIAYPMAMKTLHGMALPLSLIDLSFLAMREILVGAALGYGGSLVFTGAQLAGELIGQQVGFTLANVVDPMLEQEIGIISFLQFTLAIVVFISLNLHLVLVKILALSYDVVGLGGALLRWEFFNYLSDMFGRIWSAAIELAGPVLLVMLLVSVVVGFLTRTMPQLNIIVIGLPSRTLIGLLALCFVARPFILSMGRLCEQ